MGGTASQSYGVRVANGSFTLSGGITTAQGYTQALGGTATPTLTHMTATASAHYDGLDAAAYDSANNAGYQWFQAVPASGSITPDTAAYDVFTAKAGLAFTLDPGAYTFSGIRKPQNRTDGRTDYNGQRDTYTITQTYSCPAGRDNQPDCS